MISKYSDFMSSGLLDHDDSKHVTETISGDFEFILEIMADESLTTSFGDDNIRVVGETNYFKIYPTHSINGIEFLVTDCTVYDRSIDMQFNIMTNTCPASIVQGTVIRENPSVSVFGMQYR